MASKARPCPGTENCKIMRRHIDRVEAEVNSSTQDTIPSSRWLPEEAETLPLNGHSLPACHSLPFTGWPKWTWKTSG